MVSHPVLFTRKELELIAKNRCYKDPHKMSMDALLDIIYSKPYLYTKDYNIVAKYRGYKEPHKMSTIDLINAFYRNDTKRKSCNICRKFRRLKVKNFTKKQNVSENDLRKAKKLNKLSIDDLKKIAILRRIRNYDGLSRFNLYIAKVLKQSCRK